MFYFYTICFQPDPNAVNFFEEILTKKVIYTLLLVKLCFRCIKLKGNVIILCNHLYSVYPFWNPLRFTADADIKVEFHQTSRNLITRFFTPGVLQRAGIVKLLWSEFHNDFVSTFSFHLNNEWSIEIKTTTSY